jgi:NDP-sugar pyrophosphorylase family protein
MNWEDLRNLFFEDLKAEWIGERLLKQPPWEVLKELKSFLYDSLPEIPRILSQKQPLLEDYFLSTEGDLIPLNQITKEEDNYFFRGTKIKGAILMAGTYIKGTRFYFGEGVIVEPFSYLEEPAYFSEGTQIRHASYVRGSVYTGKGAVIGHTTEVKNSIFLKGAKAAHFAYVGDSILGAEVNLGAGTKLANLKFLKREITFEINEVKFKTGLRKMGAILGDRVQTGCNVVLQPGTLLGKGSVVYPGMTAGSGFFPPGSKIKS